MISGLEHLALRLTAPKCRACSQDNLVAAAESTHVVNLSLYCIAMQLGRIDGNQKVFIARMAPGSS